MSDGALREDVVSALTATSGVAVTRVAADIIEVAKAGQPLRAFRLRSTVSRGLLYEFERYYGVQLSAFYPLPFRDVKKNAV